MKKIALVALIAFAALSFVFFSCGKKDDKPEDCPSFEDYQLYPADGGPDTQFELFVLLKDKDANEHIVGIRADLYTSDGWSAGPSYDLVQSDADPFRFLHSFTGLELCPEGTCNVFFEVVAEHKDGCIKAFDTDIIQIVTPQSDTDDDVADDSADDAADDTGDDTVA